MMHTISGLLPKQDAVAAAAAETEETKEDSELVPTANGALAHATTGRPGVDLFYHLARGQSRERTQQLFAAAWKSSPEDALRIVLQARDIRDGKGERDVVFMCLLWMRTHKPRTYLGLLPHVLRFGSYHDLVRRGNTRAHVASLRALISPFHPARKRA
jgi:hypothetical protein